MKRVKETAGDSSEQRGVEPEMLEKLGARLGIELKGRKFHIRGGTRLEIDGVCETPLVLCEVYAHHGSLKSGQKHKILADAFKLVYAERLRGKPAQKIILLADKKAAVPFQGKKWIAEAMRIFDIRIEVVTLEPKSAERVRQAQARQIR